MCAWLLSPAVLFGSWMAYNSVDFCFIQSEAKLIKAIMFRVMLLNDFKIPFNYLLSNLCVADIANLRKQVFHLNEKKWYYKSW